jgi:hypothetical protein
MILEEDQEDLVIYKPLVTGDQVEGDFVDLPVYHVFNCLRKCKKEKLPFDMT